MSPIRISVEGLERIFGGLKDHRVLLPSGSGKKGEYIELTVAGRLPRECGDHTKPSAPPKNIIFPANETLLSYKLNIDGSIEVAQPEIGITKTILFGTPPCDSASFRVLDAALTKDIPEPFYTKRRENFGVIGMACSRAGKSCFCRSVGLSPVSEAGADLMAYPDGDDFIIKNVSGRLDMLWTLIEKSGEMVSEEAFEPVRARFDIPVENYKFSAERLVDAIEKRFTDPYWTEFSSRCVSCGICTYLCPTCHCFDILDVETDERSGTRVRTQDTCQFPEFTGETSAHNPRKERYTRQRQRVLHKFLYFFRNHGMMMCTGCGRCIRYCPVDINIAEGVMKLGGTQ